jgi:hypothetical protein
MERSIALLALALALAPVAFTADSAKKDATQTATEQAVEARSRAWAKSAVDGNADVFRSFMTKNYVLLYVDPKTGKHPARWVAKTGDEWVESLRSGRQKYMEVKLWNTKVRLNGDLAVFAGEYSETGVEGGKKYTESGFFAETWIERDGQWFAVDSVFP